MKKNLEAKNLMAVYYDRGNQSYELEFVEDGEKYFIEVSARDHEEAATDEWYFEREEVLASIAA
mgnify:CR=1 FL=1